MGYGAHRTSIFIAVTNKKNAKARFSSLGESKCANFTPYGANIVVKGAIKTRPSKLTCPRLAWGKAGRPPASHNEADGGRRRDYQSESGCRADGAVHREAECIEVRHAQRTAADPHHCRQPTTPDGNLSRKRKSGGVSAVYKVTANATTPNTAVNAPPLIAFAIKTPAIDPKKIQTPQDCSKATSTTPRL